MVARERGAKFGVESHAVAVAPDIDQVAVVHQPVDQGRRHYFIPEYFAPFRLSGCPLA